MKEEIIKFLKKNIHYILIFIIICLIIIIGFIVTKKNEKKVEIKEKVIKIEEEVEEKKTYFVDIKGEVKNPGVYELEENNRIIDVIKMSGGLTKDADTSYINLSKNIKDEMVIIIYSKEEIENYNKSLEEEKIKEIIKYEYIEKECVCPNTINDACIEKEEIVSSGEFKEEIKNEEKIENNNIETNNTEETTDENITDKDNEEKLININTATIEELQTLTGIGESKAKAIDAYRKENKFNKIEDIKNVSGIGDSLFEKIKDSITI